VEVAIITFGGTVETIGYFTTAMLFEPPELKPNGQTPMGEAILSAIDMLERRKAEYREAGISFYRPWIFMITDGAPTDSWQQAASRIKHGENHKSFAFFSVGVEGADFELLARISERQPLKLKGLCFRELFQWLSNSQQSISRSTPGDEIPLEDPTKGPNGWAFI
jgi:uncharacterized protein YegL